MTKLTRLLSNQDKHLYLQAQNEDRRDDLTKQIQGLAPVERALHEIEDKVKETVSASASAEAFDLQQPFRQASFIGQRP